MAKGKKHGPNKKGHKGMGSPYGHKGTNGARSGHKKSMSRRSGRKG